MSEEDAASLPEQLILTDDDKIAESLSERALRILASPSEQYLNDDTIGIEAIMKALIERYNKHKQIEEGLEAALNWMEWIKLREKCSCDSIRCVKCVITDDINKYERLVGENQG